LPKAHPGIGENIEASPACHFEMGETIWAGFNHLLNRQTFARAERPRLRIAAARHFSCNYGCACLVLLHNGLIDWRLLQRTAPGCLGQ
jgi:hypothetical protein